jgi:hypothetical protein
VEGTLKPEAQALINSYKLSISLWDPPDFTYANVRVLQGNRAEYIPRLEAHPQIALVKRVEGMDDQLQIYFYIPELRPPGLNLPLEEVEAILREFEHLEVVRDAVYDRFAKIEDAVVVVPEGQERQWIQTFEQYPIVKRGNLVHLIYIDQTP